MQASFPLSPCEPALPLLSVTGRSQLEALGSQALVVVARYAFVLLAVASSQFALGQASDTSIQSLDALLKSNSTQELVRALQQGRQTDVLMNWLRQRAEAGHVVAQYELARRLIALDKREAIRWFAIGRMNRVLDEKECRDGRAAGSVGLLIDANYSVLEKLTDTEQLALAEAIERGLKTDVSERGQQPPWWICAPGESRPGLDRLLPPEQRSARRKEQWDFLVSRGLERSTEAKFDAALNPDRLRIWQLEPTYWAGKEAGPGPLPTENVVWIDDNNLMFSGYSKGHRAPVFDPIYRWNLATGTVSQYAPPASGLCYFKGYISYFLREGNSWVPVEGEFGHERPASIEGQSFNSERFRCRFFQKSETPHKPPIWLLEYGGKIKREDRFRRTPAEYFPEGQDAPVIFDPFEGYRDSGDRLSATAPIYSQYLDAGVMRVTTGTIGAGSPPRVWLLFRDGRVEKQEIPAGPWAAGSSYYYPAKRGWAAISATRGLYLLEKGRSTKVLSGDAIAARVSPNGCRVAVVTRLLRGEGSPMWVVDTCEKGEQR